MFRGLTINTAELEEAHIYAENEAAIYQSIVGNGDCVLKYGDVFKMDVLSYNTVRVNSGLVAVQGHMGIIEINDDQDLIFENGVSGVNRTDLIVAEFSTTGNHGIDTFALKVIKGAPGGATPEITVEDLNKGGTKRQFAIGKVTINGLSIARAELIPKPVPSVLELQREIHGKFSSGTKPPEGGQDGDIYIMYEQ